MIIDPDGYNDSSSNVPDGVVDNLCGDTNTSSGNCERGIFLIIIWQKIYLHVVGQIIFQLEEVLHQEIQILYPFQTIVL